MKTGRYSVRVASAELPEQSEVRALLAEHEAAIVSDLGGREALSAIQIDLVRSYQTCDCIELYLTQRVLREGPISAKGRTRAAVSVLMSIIDRKLRIAQQLGITRAPRAVETLADYFARLEDERQHADNVQPEPETEPAP